MTNHENVQSHLSDVLRNEIENTIILCGAGVSHEAPSLLPTAPDLMHSYLEVCVELLTRRHGIPVLDWIGNILPHVSRRVQFEIFFSHASRYLDADLRFLHEALALRGYNWLHKWLATYVFSGGTVWTTNFDLGIENAYIANYRTKPRIVIDWTEEDSTLITGHGIRKLHGSLRGETQCMLAARIEDVARHAWLLSRNRPLIQARGIELRGKHLIVLGYSGSDTLDIMPLLENTQLESLTWVQHTEPSVVARVSTVPFSTQCRTTDWARTIAMNTRELLAQVTSVPQFAESEGRPPKRTPREIAKERLAEYSSPDPLLHFLSDVVYASGASHRLDAFWQDQLIERKDAASYGRVFLAKCYSRKRHHFNTIVAQIEHELVPAPSQFESFRLRALYVAALREIKEFREISTIEAAKLEADVMGTQYEAHFLQILRVHELIDEYVGTLADFVHHASSLLEAGQYDSFVLYAFNVSSMLISRLARGEVVRLQTSEIKLILEMTEKCVRIFNFAHLRALLDYLVIYGRHRGVIDGDADQSVRQMIRSKFSVDEDSRPWLLAVFGVATERYPRITFEEILEFSSALYSSDTGVELSTSEQMVLKILQDLCSQEGEHAESAVRKVLINFHGLLARDESSLKALLDLLAWCTSESSVGVEDFIEGLSPRWRASIPALNKLLPCLKHNLKAASLEAFVRHLAPGDVWPSLARAEELKLAEQCAEAIALLERLPQDLIEVQEELADCYTTVGDYANGLSHARRALVLNEKSHTAWYIVGHILSVIDNTVTPTNLAYAQLALMRALKYCGYNPEIVKELIATCMKTGDAKLLEHVCRAYSNKMADDAGELLIRTVSEVIDWDQSGERREILQKFYRDSFMSGCSRDPRSYRHIIDLRLRFGLGARPASPAVQKLKANES